MSAETSEHDETEEPPGAFLHLLLFSPVIAMLATMRWNIGDKLDADLAFIFYWIVDAFLCFLLAYPFYSATRNESLKRFIAPFLTGTFTVISILAVLAGIAFIAATFYSFHYLMNGLANWAW